MHVITGVIWAADPVHRRSVSSEPRWRPPEWTCRYWGSQQAEGHGDPWQPDRQLRWTTNQSGAWTCQAPATEITRGCLMFFAVGWYCDEHTVDIFVIFLLYSWTVSSFVLIFLSFYVYFVCDAETVVNFLLFFYMSFQKWFACCGCVLYHRAALYYRVIVNSVCVRW